MTDDPFSEPLRFAVSRRVSEETRKRSPIDELQRTEERCLADLATKVHRDRYVGESWPKVERVPLVHDFRYGWKEADPEAVARGDITPHEWRIYVSVVAVPK